MDIAEIRQVIIAKFNYFEPARWHLATTSSEWYCAVADYDKCYPPTKAVVLEALARETVPRKVIVSRAAALFGTDPAAASIDLIAQWITEVPMRTVTAVSDAGFVLSPDDFLALVAEYPDRALMMMNFMAFAEYIIDDPPQWEFLPMFRRYTDPFFLGQTSFEDGSECHAHRILLLVSFANQNIVELGTFRGLWMRKDLARMIITPEFAAILVNLCIVNSKHHIIRRITAAIQHFKIAPIRDIDLMLSAKTDAVAEAMMEYYAGNTPDYDMFDEMYRSI